MENQVGPEVTTFRPFQRLRPCFLHQCRESVLVVRLDFQPAGAESPLACNMLYGTRA